MRSAVQLTKLCLLGAQQSAACSTHGSARLALGSQQLISEVAANRTFASSSDHGEAPPKPDAFTELLMKVVPPIVALPRIVITTAISTAGSIAHGLASSGPAKAAVTYAADKLLLAEPVYSLDEQDVAAWAYWLATAGYTNKDTFAKLAAAAKAKIPDMSPSKVEQLVLGLHKAHHYDRDVFNLVAANIKESFTEYETEGLLKIVAAFSEFGHYEESLFDDIADSITYCNSMYASEAASLEDVAGAFAAYAKFNHARGDLFNTLQRGLWTLYKKKKLDASKPADLVDSVLKISRAFDAFHYWPYNTQMVLGVAKKRADLFTAAELKEIDDYATKAEAQWGKLTYYREGYADFKHYQEHAQVIAPVPNLYAFDETLVPREYSPAALRADLKQA